MSKKLFSVVLLASLFVANSSIFASAPAEDVKVAAEVKATPSVVTRAVNAVTSTACSAAAAVKSATQSATTQVSEAAVKTASATSAFVVAAYNLSWVNHRGATCASLAALTAFLLYNYNDSVRSSVRSFFGLDEQACRFCPSACSQECGTN